VLAIRRTRLPWASPPNRLVLTWGWTHDHAVPPGTTRVVITLHAENGGTRAVLRHHNLPDQEQRDHHRKGWTLPRPTRPPDPGYRSRPGPERLTRGSHRPR